MEKIKSTCTFIVYNKFNKKNEIWAFISLLQRKEVGYDMDKLQPVVLQKMIFAYQLSQVILGYGCFIQITSIKMILSTNKKQKTQTVYRNLDARIKASSYIGKQFMFLSKVCTKWSFCNFLIIANPK